MYTNIQSLGSKFSELLSFVQYHRPCIIMLSETWLKSSISDSVCTIPTYSLYRDDNKEAIGHRGVCVYVKDFISDNFNIQVVHKDWPGIDNLFLDISSGDFSITLGCVYRPRPCLSDVALTDFLCSLSSTKNNVFIAGDFNCPDLRWPLMHVPPSTSPSYPYAKLFADSALHQLVLQPTRFRNGQNPSLLDWMISSDSNLISEVAYQPPIGKSDHVVLTATLQMNLSYDLKRHTRTISIINYDAVNSELSGVNWMDLFDEYDDIDVLWNKFVDIMKSKLSKYTRIKTIKLNPLKPWIDGKVLEMIRCKKSLWQRYLRSRSDADYRNHRSYSNFVSSEIDKAKTSYESQLASGKNRKKFFKYMRATMNSKVSAPLVRNSAGDKSKDARESADSLAEVFASVYCSEPDGPLPSVCVPGPTAELGIVSVDEELVLRHLLCLKESSSPGPDGISPFTLRKCAPAIALPLSLIFRKSLATSALPREWLRASVTPIFKGGDKLSPNNYRPISLTSSISKVLEKVVCEQLLHFALTHHIVPREQHGFVPGRSTMTNLLYCLNDWTRSLDQGIPVDVLYLDFSKAFDRVPHRRLLSKLQHLGIGDALLSWIKAFLSNRTFRVRVADVHSSEDVLMTSGVPQGSVLGPILFVIYTSDLPRLLRSPCALFADDTKIYNLSSNIETLQDDLQAVENWCREWLLPLNTSKCQVLHLGRNNPKLTYVIDGQCLTPVDHHNDLGIVVSHDLSWSQHVASIVAKSKQMTHMIQRSFRGCSLETSRMLYCSYVRPLMEYAGPVWCPSLRSDQLLLESVQRWNTRIPFGRIRPDYHDRLRLMNLQTFEDRRNRGDLIVTYRALNGFFGVNLDHLYMRSSTQLRGHAFKLAKENFRTTQRQTFLPNRVFEVWNRLPHSVVGALTVNSFKNRLDQFTRDQS